MNRKGSYLLEVMCIMTIITSFLLLIPISKRDRCGVKVDLFIKQLNQDIQYGISYSLTHVTLIKIYFLPDMKIYLLKDGSLKTIIKRNYDNEIILNAYKIDISHGYVLKKTSMNLSCGNKSYLITINEKSGLINES